MGDLGKMVPDALRTFIEPQIEQLSMTMEPLRCGVYGTVPKEVGEGFLWAAPIGDDCLVAVHSLRLGSPLVLEERPTDFSCIFSGSRATLLSLPERPPRPPSERENLAAFSQAGGVTRCALQAGALYESTSITYTPECLDRLRKAFPGDFDDVDEAMRSFDPASAPAEMLSVLRSFTPARAALPGAAAYFHAKALEAIAALSMRPGPAAPKARREDQELVEQAEAVMSARLSERLTAESIAGELFVSRSRLCEAFRRVRGSGVAETLRKERMDAACRLLSAGGAHIADVARAVGYARSSSFDEAFRREFGCSPAQWRQDAV